MRRREQAAARAGAGPRGPAAGRAGRRGGGGGGDTWRMPIRRAARADFVRRREVDGARVGLSSFFGRVTYL